MEEGTNSKECRQPLKDRKGKGSIFGGWEREKKQEVIWKYLGPCGMQEKVQGQQLSIRNIQYLQRRITKYAFSPRLNIRIFAVMKIKIKLNKFKASFCPCAP